MKGGGVYFSREDDVDLLFSLVFDETEKIGSFSHFSHVVPLLVPAQTRMEGPWGL